MIETFYEMKQNKRFKIIILNYVIPIYESEYLIEIQPKNIKKSLNFLG